MSVEVALLLESSLADTANKVLGLFVNEGMRLKLTPFLERLSALDARVGDATLVILQHFVQDEAAPALCTF